MRHLLATLLLFFAAASVFAQQKELPLVQFSGVVHNADSTSVVVPYVTITNLTDHNRQDLANYQGYFSFVAHERDTLRFTCVGYAPQTVVIPQNLNKSYTIQIDLKPQITNLPTFRVFPWATTDEFKKDFLSMKRADDDIEIARKNGKTIRRGIYMIFHPQIKWRIVINIGNIALFAQSGLECFIGFRILCIWKYFGNFFSDHFRYRSPVEYSRLFVEIGKVKIFVY